ncbi:MAG: histidine--tRNA ligase [Candidatus Sulfotelmatobacter sp.]
MIKAVRGTRDLLPPETAVWNFVEETAREVFRAYNFQEIRTPIFESTELFARGVGEETDIVSKEMYTWADGADPADFALYKEWLIRNMKEGPFEEVEPEKAKAARGSAGPTLFIAQNGEVKLVRFRYGASPSEVRQLARDSQNWGAPNSLHEILLVTLLGSIPEGTRNAASECGVRIEEIAIKGLELPHSLTLRPEATAGVVRAYIEHDLEKRGLNKLYCIGPMFRRERPQKGRYRQFYQIDAEVIGPPSSGSESPARDAEILEMIATLLDRLGIRGWDLKLNSVGCKDDRAKFNEALRKALEPVAAQMCADCQRRAVTNPLRVFDCKVPADQPIIEKLPRISQFLDEPCRKHFDAVQEILIKVGVEFQINDRLVRGLDYYTRTAFEFTHGALGAQNAILGGGRYDGLSEALGGPPAPGIGFAIGEDRLVMSLQESLSDVVKKPDAYIAPLGAGMNPAAALLARELRRQNLVVDLGDEHFRLKKSFEAATKAGAKYILIVGENELKADAFALKNLATGEQVSVPRGELAQKIRE